MSVLNLFRRNTGKWHEVRWRNGQRHIFLALRFAIRDGDQPPAVEKLPPPQEAAEGAGAVLPAPPDESPDEATIVREIQSAVAEYNRMNQCALRVAAIRHQATGAAEPIDFGTATRKLLNLL